MGVSMTHYVTDHSLDLIENTTYNATCFSHGLSPSKTKSVSGLCGRLGFKGVPEIKI